MQEEGLRPDRYTFLGSLKACIVSGSARDGLLIHQQVIENGIERDTIIANAIVDMYMKCRCLEEGHKLFNSLTHRDVVTWGSIITGYVQSGDGCSALQLYEKMYQDGIDADVFLLSSVLKACGIMGDERKGMLVHDKIIQNGHQSDVVVVNALIDMYLKCGDIIQGSHVFNGSSRRDLVSWNAMIAGHVLHDNAMVAIRLFEEMLAGVVKPNKITYSCILKSCSIIGDLDLGIAIHKEMQKSDIEIDMVVKNALIDMYSKCGGTKECLEIFKELASPDIVSWNAVFAGCAEHGHGRLALELFKKMQEGGVKPDNVTFSSLLKVCGIVGALQQGKLIHDSMVRTVLKFDPVVCISLIDMYAKCAAFDDAHNLLKKPLFHCVESWNAVIAGYSWDGNCGAVSYCLKEMQKQGLKPNCRTYSSVLAACSHVGVVGQGCEHFERMIKVHGITPGAEHLNCIVDLFSRVGQLEEAEKFLQTMPIDLSLTGWRSLLTSCKVHGNVHLGEDCYDQAVQLD